MSINCNTATLLTNLKTLLETKQSSNSYISSSEFSTYLNSEFNTAEISKLNTAFGTSNLTELFNEMRGFNKTDKFWGSGNDSELSGEDINSAAFDKVIQEYNAACKDPCKVTHGQRKAVANGRDKLKQDGGGSAGKGLATLLPTTVDDTTELTIPNGTYPVDITSKDFVKAMEDKGYTLKTEYQCKEGNKALWKAVSEETSNDCAKFVAGKKIKLSNYFENQATIDARFQASLQPLKDRATTARKNTKSRLDSATNSLNRAKATGITAEIDKATQAETDAKQAFEKAKQAEQAALAATDVTEAKKQAEAAEAAESDATTAANTALNAAKAAESQAAAATKAKNLQAAKQRATTAKESAKNYLDSATASLSAAKGTGITVEINKAKDAKEAAEKAFEKAQKAEQAALAATDVTVANNKAKAAETASDEALAAANKANNAKKAALKARNDAQNALSTSTDLFSSGTFGGSKRMNQKEFKEHIDGYNKGSITYLRDKIQNKIDNFDKKTMINKGKLKDYVKWLNEMIPNAPDGNVGE